jgi:hypothetical protein
MGPMARRLAALVACPVLALAACGAGEPPLHPSCTESPQAIEKALQRAPRAVTLAGGARLSDCVSSARTDADLQEAGLVLTGAADDLAFRAQRGDARAAIARGYRVGAARRGAARTAGIQAELQRRVEHAAAFLEVGGPAVAAAVRRGMRAGEATG